jgi:hypothetical protein
MMADKDEKPAKKVEAKPARSETPKIDVDKTDDWVDAITSSGAPLDVTERDKKDG